VSGEPALLRIDADRWDAIFFDGRQGQLERVLPAYLQPRRWFGAKTRTIKGVSLSDTVLLGELPGGPAYLALVSVDYVQGSSETYLLPMAYADGERAAQILADARHTVIARLSVGQDQAPGLLYDPLGDRAFARALLDLIRWRQRLRGARGGELSATPARALRGLIGDADPAGLEPSVLRGEQSNSSVNFGGRLIMKLFRKIESGVNPDLEIGRYLTDERAFPHTPPVAGAIEYQRGKDEPLTLAILQGFVQNEGNARIYALDVLQRYFDQVQSRADLVAPDASTTISALLDAAESPPTALASELIGVYLHSAELLGQRTAEMHLALAAGTGPAFAPEPFSQLYQRSLYQSMRSLTVQTMQGLRKLLPTLPESIRPEAEAALASEEALLARFQRIVGAKIEASRTRTHGDYHLEQVLFTGSDYMIIDFEGEPLRPISERRIKRTPLRDVAGMLRSFEYAAYSALFSRTGGTTVTPDEAALLRRWADYWTFWASAAFLGSYIKHTGAAPFMPAARADLETLLEVYVLEKAVYELGYEMNNRPTWMSIPLSGILRQSR
jgi:maltose alpha-D-glucosyltransferase/alpha-amylase